MSQAEQRAERIERGNRAFREGTFDELADLLTPDFEFYSALAESVRGRTGGAVYRGIEGLKELRREYTELFDDLRFETEGLEERPGDRVLERVRMRGTGRGSGIELDLEIFRVWTFAGDRVRRIDALLTREEAESALEHG